MCRQGHPDQAIPWFERAVAAKEKGDIVKGKEVFAAQCATCHTFDTQGEETGIDTLLLRLGEHHIGFKDLQSSESSLEDIFVSLVRAQP